MRESCDQTGAGTCYGLTSLTIPDNVTRIEDWAFSDCYGLTNLTIGNNVNSIGSESVVIFQSATNPQQNP